MPTILVVEDDAAIQIMVTDILEDEGYTVLRAGHGGQALAILATHLPDLLVTDIMMPEMDGVTLCAAVQANPQTARLPIIVMSAGANAELAFRCHATAFLAKPFPMMTLLTSVAAVL
jgi:CheY-like chemotaxis protein